MAKHALDIGKLDFAELLQLRDEIETALNGKIAMEQKELQSKMAELESLQRKLSRNEESAPKKPKARRKARTTASRSLKGRKVQPKYRGPKGETWAGRGLAPRWLTALEKKGKKREQFLIEN
jgi:DNA-binding protein H-NS